MLLPLRHTASSRVECGRLFRGAGGADMRASAARGPWAAIDRGLLGSLMGHCAPLQFGWGSQPALVGARSAHRAHGAIVPRHCPMAAVSPPAGTWRGCNFLNGRPAPGHAMRGEHARAGIHPVSTRQRKRVRRLMGSSRAPANEGLAKQAAHPFVFSVPRPEIVQTRPLGGHPARLGAAEVTRRGGTRLRPGCLCVIFRRRKRGAARGRSSCLAVAVANCTVPTRGPACRAAWARRCAACSVRSGLAFSQSGARERATRADSELQNWSALCCGGGDGLQTGATTCFGNRPRSGLARHSTGCVQHSKVHFALVGPVAKVCVLARGRNIPFAPQVTRRSPTPSLVARTGLDVRILRSGLFRIQVRPGACGKGSGGPTPDAPCYSLVAAKW